MDESDTIGTASMEEDGSIVLRLRAEGHDGAVGEALLTYRPSDDDYARILDHLGGLRPGQQKHVAPFPERWPSPS